ncbi:MAG: FtsP/CotA-like multicopper oxidase with cupredoxin domain, partial [Myxococcota bacterium]
RNLSPTEHPFHLHGHAFEVISLDGEAPPHYMLEDTLNIPIRQTARLRLLADNPGDWMTHCHILPHAGQGMMTVLRVE